MQTHSEVHSATSRSSSANNAEISWHTANTAKTYQALSLFANVKANLHASPAAPSHAAAVTTSPSTRRGSAPSAGHAQTSHAEPRLSGASRPAHQPRRGSSASTSPRRDTAASPALAYTEAEVASMSPAQLRRQLKVAAAATQRLHRRTRHLEREVEMWKVKAVAQHGPPHATSEATQGSSSDASVQALKAAERRAQELQVQVEQLTLDKEALSQRVEEAKRAAHTARQLPPTHPTVSEPATSVSNGGNVLPSSASTAASRGSESELLLLRDTVRQLQHRLELSEGRVQRAVQVQLDAVLSRSTSAASHQPPKVAMVNAEVQRLFQLMQEQLLSNAAQQQAERARMNELFYQLERQRGLL